MGASRGVPMSAMNNSPGGAPTATTTKKKTRRSVVPHYP